MTSSPRSHRRPIECFCPNCEEKHIINMFWTGKGTPKKFCKKNGCKDKAEEYPEYESHRSVPKGRRAAPMRE